jgi:hypothetical protein
MIQAMKKEGMTMKTGTIRSLMMLAGCLLLGPQVTNAQQPPAIITVVPAVLNDRFPDEDGDFPAYIECTSEILQDLAGLYLTDNQTQPTKWRIPLEFTFSTASPNVRIFASGKNRQPLQGELHTSFIYDCSVPFCGLYFAGTSAVQLDTFSDQTDHCACNGINLISANSIARTLIPPDDIGSDWVQVDYPDELTWKRGPLGIGYDSPESPFCADLILYHTMDQQHISGTTMLDQSGPTLHDGTINGAPSPGAGVVMGSLVYQPTNDDFIKVTHHSELNVGVLGFTAAIWVNPKGAPRSREVIVSKGGSGQGDPGWRIERGPDGTRVQVVSAAGAIYTSPISNPPSDTWSHLVLVVDETANTLTGFFNGQPSEVVSLSATANDDFTTDKDLLEARDDIGNHFDGQLDEFGIWDKPLTAAQISSLFLAGESGTSLKDPTLGGGGAVGGTSTLYGPCIGTDVLAEMKGKNPSAYIRVPFNLSSFPGSVTSLKLTIAYDDGFQLYLNGGLVASRNAPTATSWNSTSANPRDDNLALTAEQIDLTAFAGLLRQGKNVLAIQGFNSDVDASRFLIKPEELCLEQRPSGGGENGCIKTTNGRDFWLAFPENFEEESDNPLQLRLCITGPRNTSGVVEVPGLPFTTSFTIPASGAITISVPKQAELEGRDQIEKKGIHVIASAPVGVVGLTRMDFTTDTFLALPTLCLGTEYIVLSMDNVHNNVPLLQGTQLAIVAPADDTLVSITPRQTIGSHPLNVTYQILLQRGQTYQLRHEGGAGSDISGTEILSDKPIAVLGSHRCANIADTASFFCDTVVEHLLPVPAWDKSYHVTPLRTRATDIVKVVAAHDNTDIAVDGSNLALLNRGETFEFVLTGTNAPPVGARVTSKMPFLLSQFSRSSNADGVIDADPFMVNLSADSRFMDRHVICSPPSSGFSGNYINVVAATATILNDVQINGVSMNTLPGLETGTFPSSAYVFARVLLPSAPDNVHVISAGRGPFGLTVYGFDEFDSYGHSGAMQFPDAGPPLIVCPSELVVACEQPGQSCTARAPNIISLSQFYDDCTPAAQLVVTQTPTVGTPLTVGTYSVIIRATDGNGNSAECITTLVVLENWEERNFGPAVVGDPSREATVWGFFADPDEDGLINGYEQHIDSDPNNPDDPSSPFATEIVTENGSTFLKISFIQPVLSLAGNLLPERSSNLIQGAWEPGLDLFEPLPYETFNLPGGAYQEVFFKALETVDPTALREYFVRLSLRPIPPAVEE